MPEPRPTHRTIAKEAGVSSVTVSLALRNHPSISEPTRLRVQAIAEALGYRPDPEISKLMHRLRSQRRKNLAANLVALRPGSSQALPAYDQQVLRGAKERADSLGYALEVMSLDAPRVSADRLGKTLRSRGVEGVLLLPMPPADLSLRLDWSSFSVVATSFSVLKPRFNTVVPNQFSNMLRLCAALAEKGESRVGVITNRQHDVKVNHRFTSAYLWHTALGDGEPIPPLVLAGANLPTEQIVSWIKKHRPTTIITDSEGLQVSICNRLSAELSRASRWICTGLAGRNEGIEGIFENPEEIGRAAIETLAAMIQRGERGIPEWPRVTEIEGEVRLGGPEPAKR
jgi:LacI family transcriptional regulator